MKKLTATITFLWLSTITFAQGKIFKTDEGAIHGYDPVAYFTDQKPMKGKKEFSLQWNEATWYFASNDNLEKFKANPEKFAPQFGGYCAYGLSRGYKAKTEPDAWTIVGDKLYLNYDVGVMKKWREEKEERIPKAEENWKKIENEK